jgi:hypothetical protein
MSSEIAAFEAEVKEYKLQVRSFPLTHHKIHSANPYN